MQCLVTGGAGFIGSHLTEHLLSEGHEVTVLARPGESLDNLAGLPVRVVHGDLLDPAGLRRLDLRAQILYHLAARTDLDGTAIDEYRVNTEGTRNVCQVARQCEVQRLVFYSSMLAVGLTGSREPISEAHTASNPVIYGQSKRIGEEIVASSGVPWTVIRPTLVFGPRERSTMMAFFRAIKRRQFMLIGDDVWQSFVYVKNLVHATYQASICPAAAGRVYFIDDARARTLAEFATAAARACGTSLNPVRLPRAVAMAGAVVLEAIQRVLGIRVPLTPSRVRTMTTHYVYSTERARADFGYAPPHDLERATAETAQWYLERGLL